MKRTLIVLGVLAILVACATSTRIIPTPPIPGVVTLYAQSVPVVIHAEWDPPPAGDNDTAYVVTIDGTAQPSATLPAVDATCSCIKVPVSIASFGSHTVSVQLQNQEISTDGSSLQSSTAASVTFTLSAAPTSPGHVKAAR